MARDDRRRVFSVDWRWPHRSVSTSEFSTGFDGRASYWPPSECDQEILVGEANHRLNPGTQLGFRIEFRRGRYRPTNRVDFRKFSEDSSRQAVTGALIFASRKHFSKPQDHPRRLKAMRAPRARYRT